MLGKKGLDPIRHPGAFRARLAGGFADQAQATGYRLTLAGASLELWPGWPPLQTCSTPTLARVRRQGGQVQAATPRAGRL